MQWPEPLQLILVNSAVLPFANLQLAFDLSRERFHSLRKCLGASYFGQDTAFCQSCFDRALLAIATLTADSGESTGGILNTATDFVSPSSW